MPAGPVLRYLVDSYLAPFTRARWRTSGREATYVRVLRSTEPDYVGHIVRMHYGDGYSLPWSSGFTFCTKSIEEYPDLHAAHETMPR